MNRIGKVIAAILAALMAAAFIPACAQTKKQTATWFEYFDTVITLTAYTDDDALFAEAAGKAGETFRFYHRLFDIYNEYDDVVSIAEVNRRAGERVGVNGDVAALAALGVSFAERTGGAVNIAMGAVLRLWHDCRAASENGEPIGIPDDEALKDAALHCDASNVIVGEGSIMLADERMSLDVGAIAKGFAADKAAEKLKGYGFPFMLNCGGAVLAYGEKPGGELWKVGVANPMGSGGFAVTLELSDEALSTSGSYLRSFTVDGVKYGHIIDPVTLYPANLTNGQEGERIASVSVKCGGDGCAALADALSTACYVLGFERGSELIKREGAEAVFVFENGKIVSVP